MKRVAFALLFLTAIFTGCSQDQVHPSHSNLQKWMEPSGRLKVVSTIEMIGDVVKHVGGDQIDHMTLIVGEVDPHSYELVKGDGEKLEYADIIFYNGLGLEHGASLSYQIGHHRKAVGLGDILYQTDADSFLMTDGEVDPHIWMDMEFWAKIVDPIVETLSSADPDHAQTYRSNGTAFRELLLEKHRSMRVAIQQIPSDFRFLVTSHDAFNYFTRAYLAEGNESDWRKRFKAPEGLAPDGQMGLSDIRGVVNHLCRYQIGVVFPESNVSRDSLRKIKHVCQKKGLEVTIAETPLYGDSMGRRGTQYIEMIEHNVETLIAHWKKCDEK